MKTNKNGFTLIEMVMVIIVIGILASIALPLYIKTIEKSRTAEARSILGQIRTAELAYYLEFESYTASGAALSISNTPIGVGCNANFHFNYSIVPNGAAFVATASRCTSGGKDPNVAAAYSMNLTQDGVLDCSVAGYL